MKKFTIILLIVLMISGYGLAKSKMNPQMQDIITQEFNDTSRHFVLVMKDVPSSIGCFCLVYAKEAGESGITWKQKSALKMLSVMKTKVKVTLAIKRTFGDRISCDSTLIAGKFIKLLRIKPQKWGFRITLSPVKGQRYTTNETETYTQRYRIDGEIKEVQETRRVVDYKYKTTTLDFMFHKKRYANTPENIQFIRDTFARVFKSFESKEEAMVYIDKEILDYTVAVGMTIDQVVEKIGTPKNKRQSESQLIYDYELWNIKFENNKVVDVQLL